MAKGEVRYRLTLDTADFKSGAAVFKNEVQQMGDALGSKLGKAGEVLASLGPAAVAVSVGIGAIVAAATAAAAAVGKLASYADRLSALKDQTGLSTAALQKFELAAKLGNSSLEAVAAGVNKMQRELVEGSKAFGMLGLSIDELKKLSPEEQLQAVAQAIDSLGTDAEKSAARMAIFGKSGNDLAGTLKAVSEGAADLGGELSDKTVTAAGDLRDELDRLETAWERVQLQMAAVIAENPKLMQGLKDLVDLLAKAASWINENSEAIGKWAAGLTRASMALSTLGMSEGFRALKGIKDYFSPGAGAEFQVGGGGGGGDIWNGGLMGAGGGKKGPVFDPVALAAAEKHAKEVAAAAKKTADEWERAKKHMQEALAGAPARDFGNLVRPGFMHNMPVLLGGGGSFGAMKGMEGKDYGGLLQFTQNRAAPLQLQATLSYTMRQAFSGAIADLPNVVMGALQGGGNVMQATGGLLGGALGKGLAPTLTKSLSDVLGKTLGGALGALAPGIGTLLGAGLGKLFGGLFGGSEEKKVNPMRQQFIDAAGGLDALNKQAHAAGITLDHLLNAKTVKDYQAAIEELTGALDFQTKAQNELNSAAEKYGFTTQAMADQTGGELLKNWELLNAAGFDHAEILKRMAPDFNEYVQTMIKGGQAIPENFRPIIEEMIKMGLLTDENGKAFGSLEEAGITFTDSLSDGLKSLIEEIHKLIQALGGVPDSLPDYSQGGGAGAPAHGGPRSGEHFGSGGYSPPGPESLNWTGTGSGEYHVPGGPDWMSRLAGELGPYLAGGGGPQTMAGKLEVDLKRGVGELTAEAYTNNEGGLRQTIRRDLGLT